MGCWLGLRGPEGCERDGLRCTDVAVTRAGSCWGGGVTGERAVTVVVLLQVRSHVRVDACARVDMCGQPWSPVLLLGWRVMVCGWGSRVLFPGAGGRGRSHGCVPLIEIWLPFGVSVACVGPQHDADVERCGAGGDAHVGVNADVRGCMCVGVMPCVCEAEGAQWRACAQRAASRAPPRTPRATPRTPAPCACRRVIPVPCAPRTRCRAARSAPAVIPPLRTTYSVPPARTSSRG